MPQARTEEQRPPLRVIVAFNVWRHRKAKGFSQEKLARRSDLSRNTITAIEDARDPTKSENDVRIGTLAQIAAALELEATDLLVWDPVAMHQSGWSVEAGIQLPLVALVRT